MTPAASSPGQTADEPPVDSTRRGPGHRGEDAGPRLTGTSAIVVLGCAVALAEGGRLARGALVRRVERAAFAYAELGLGADPDRVVIASGGRRWDGAVEADAMAAELARRGVPAEVIVRERASLSTRDNARFAAAALARRGLRSAYLVTCEWHMPRAQALFFRAGVDVTPVAAVGPRPTLGQRIWRRVREGTLTWFLVLAASFVLAACSPSSSSPAHAGGALDGAMTTAEANPAALLDRIEKAGDRRRPEDLPIEAATSRDARARRAYASALAQMGPGGEASLFRILNDEDPEAVAWAAYGLGRTCAGEDPARISALAARLVAMGAVPRAAEALLWALGRCGGDLAARAIAPWLRGGSSIAEAAAYALGEAVAHGAALSPGQASALLDAAEASPPSDAAFYAFSYVDRPLPPALSARLAVATQKAIARPGPLRTLAIRARGVAGDDAAAADLLHLLTGSEAVASERVEAVRALARLGKPGQAALAEAAVALPRSSEALLDPAATDSFVSALAILRALSGPVPTRAEPALWAIARLDCGTAAAAIRRRASLLRCAAALALARGTWESDVLTQCDVGDGEAGEHARVDALDRRTLGPAGRAAWATLLASPHLRVRESALDLGSRHAELGDAARAPVIAGLRAPEPGMVATAARVLRARPDTEGSTIDALRAALARSWPPDAVQTRLALLDVAASEAVATALPEARTFAEAACADPNATLRARAARILPALGAKPPGDTGALCPAPESPPAPEIGHEIAEPVRITLDTDHGALVLHLDPRFAPIAVTRIVALARSGFYDGTVIHRVVPGFVVQLGDPSGDGYGGAGRLLRCETAPVAFERLDVGVALAGRDTGSSQIFVALARSPHLDGESAWIGSAEPSRGAGSEWDAVVEGDVIRSARVDP